MRRTGVCALFVGKAVIGMFRGQEESLGGDNICRVLWVLGLEGRSGNVFWGGKSGNMFGKEGPEGDRPCAS